MNIKGEQSDLNQQVKHIIYFDAFLIGTSTFGRLQSGASALYFNVETYYILIVFELSKRHTVTAILLYFGQNCSNI